MSNHVTRMSDSSLYDEVCVNCGETDANGPLTKKCLSAPKSKDQQVHFTVNIDLDAADFNAICAAAKANEISLPDFIKEAVESVLSGYRALTPTFLAIVAAREAREHEEREFRKLHITRDPKVNPLVEEDQ